MKRGTAIVLSLALASAVLGVACGGSGGSESVGPSGSVKPDTAIAFVARAPGEPLPKVHLIDADSGAVQQLTDTEENEWWPTWSRDRQGLAFIAWPPPATSGTPSTQEGSPVPEEASPIPQEPSPIPGEASPTPQGTSPSPEDIRQRHLVVANADGSDQHSVGHSMALENLLGSFSWSPDDGEIIATSVSDLAEQPLRAKLRTFNVADGSEVPLAEERFGYLPAWSPDGTKIVFGAYVGQLDERGKGESELFLMDSDGTNLRQITDRPGIDVSPSWSPDSTRIAWTGQSAESDPSARRSIFFMMDVASSQVTELGEGSDPIWSPDGQHVAFVVQETPPPGTLQSQPNVDIYTLDVATGERTRLTQDPAQDLWPTWSLDGQRIAFVSKRDSPLGEIYVMNADGSDVRRLTENDAFELMLAWAPR